MSYITSALNAGWHAVAASKGALVVGFQALKALAAENGVSLKFSGATAAALPTLDVGLFSLAGARIEGIQGILNGTSNYILTRMGEGLDYARSAQGSPGQGDRRTRPGPRRRRLGHGLQDPAHHQRLPRRGLRPEGRPRRRHRRRDVDFVRSAGREGRSVKLLATAAPGRQGETMEPRRPALASSTPRIRSSTSTARRRASPSSRTPWAR